MKIYYIEKVFKNYLNLKLHVIDVIYKKTELEKQVNSCNISHRCPQITQIPHIGKKEILNVIRRIAPSALLFC